MGRNVQWRKVEPMRYRGKPIIWWSRGRRSNMQEYRWEVSYAKYGLVNSNSIVKLYKLNDANAKVTNLRKQATVIAQFNAYSTYQAKEIIDEMMSLMNWMEYASINNNTEFNLELELLTLIRKVDIGFHTDRNDWQNRGKEIFTM